MADTSTHATAQCSFYADHFAGEHETFCGFGYGEQGTARELKVVCSVALSAESFHAVLRFPGSYECVYKSYDELSGLRRPKRRAMSLRTSRGSGIGGGSSGQRRRANASSLRNGSVLPGSPRASMAASAASDDVALPEARDVFMCEMRARNVELQEVRAMPRESHNDVVEQLVRFERALASRQYKFGVLLSGGQADETQLFANSDGSRAYAAFLQFIGRSVSLHEHGAFMGGLRADGSTGERSVYTKLESCEVMYHVSRCARTSVAAQRRVHSPTATHDNTRAACCRL